MKEGKDHIGVFVTAIINDGKGNVLMGKRGGQARDRHGVWEFGGGGLEFGEELEPCLVREIREEFGAEITDIQQIKTICCIDEEIGHWVGVYFLAKANREDVRIAEPVYDELGWFTPDSLPTPIEKKDIDSVSEIKHLL